MSVHEWNGSIKCHGTIELVFKDIAVVEAIRVIVILRTSPTSPCKLLSM